MKIPVTIAVRLMASLSMVIPAIGSRSSNGGSDWPYAGYARSSLSAIWSSCGSSTTPSGPPPSADVHPAAAPIVAVPIPPSSARRFMPQTTARGRITGLVRASNGSSQPEYPDAYNGE